MNWKNLEDYPLKDLQKMWLDYFDKPYCSNSKAFCIPYRIQATGIEIRRFEAGNQKHAD